MNTCSVTFLPEERVVRAAPGKSIMEAAVVAGIRINNVCGGDGVCGKCRVIVKSGKVTAKPNIFLTRREIQRGVALACQTYIEGDVVVEVPLESRIGGVPQLESEDAFRFGRTSAPTEAGLVFPLSPITRKEFLKLPKPEGQDALPDQERVFRELRRNREMPIMQMGLSVLRHLAETLRENEWEVTALLGYRGGTIEIIDVYPGDQSAEHYGIAVDLGTTTIVAHLVNLLTSETLATMAKYNTQSSFGEDVIARMVYASTPERRRQLQELAVDDINDLIAGLVAETRVKLQEITSVMVAGNTTMIHLLFGMDPRNIRREPYVPCASGPPTIRAAELGISINSRGILSALPSVSSYVGGDIVADVLVAGMTNSPDLTLLIDLGTNGELVLGNQDWLLCCSASAGPAFEGGGITCGMRATQGAVERIALTTGGEVERFDVVGDLPPLGLCGSGIVDVVAELLRVRCIDRSGRFLADACGARLRRSEAGELEFVLFPGEATALGRDIVITEADIRNLIHTKGSIFMATECLLDYVGMALPDIQRVYVAGGFGNYLRTDRAIAIGLLPDIDRDRFVYLGNGSVHGAKMSLLSVDAYAYARDRIAGAMTDLELSAHAKYMNEYSSCLFLPHTDLEKFPSQREPSADPVSRSRCR